MMFPLDFLQVSELLAVIAIVLVITSEILSPYYGKSNMKISRRKLRNVAIATSVLFLGTVAAEIATTIFNI